MKNLLYVLSIVAIWTILLYFFMEIYFQHPTLPHDGGKPINPVLRSQRASSAVDTLPSVNLSISSYSPFKPLMEFYQENSKNSQHFDEIKGVSRPFPPQLVKSINNPQILSLSKARLTAKDYQTADPNGIPWKSFVEMSPDPLIKGNPFPSPFSSFLNSSAEEKKNEKEFVVCSKEIEDKLKGSLSEEDYQWCEWALSDKGGKVKVRSSLALSPSSLLSYLLFLPLQ
jgi:hypothetical protein